MKAEKLKHREKFQILIYHLDRNGKATIRSIMNFMQATVNMHGRILGTSLDDFSEENFTWVFSRFNISMEKYPNHYDYISVDTWRSECKKYFAFREFEVFDSSGNKIGAATASAVLMDNISRKPIDIPPFIKEQFAPDFGRAINDDFSRIPTLTRSQNSKSFHVRLSDIDLNHHVNNTSYVDWIIESVSEEILMNYNIMSCEIDYKAEALYGDTIQSNSALIEMDDGDPQTSVNILHKLEKLNDQKITTIARTKWLKHADI